MNPIIGKWASGEPISLDRVPLDLASNTGCGFELVKPFIAANGGMFKAIYRFVSKRGQWRWIYELHRVEEIMPPTPPQIQGFSDNQRLPMMDGYGFSAHLEAEQRRREWAEVRDRQ